MPSRLAILLLLLVILVIILPSNGVYAFGAGNIPSFAFMEGRAFRHGDIEDILSGLMKKGSGGGIVGSLLGGTKFTSLDVKRVYFGNWLRDYSQAVDIAGLKKVQLQTIITMCMALGFLAHGYATHEFEVTAERLGVYLPTEHIDNPKGYGEGEDARKYHPALRPPVDPRELEIDPRTGMKNYIANESGHWDTSKALVRRTLQKCIHLGRQARSNGDKHDLYEAYRLLGQLMHTLEDFPAHSNFCELALVHMGHDNVFTHVGDHVRIQAPNRKHVAPLVTGTFGASDFIHSLLGEATDHISEASVSDLNREMNKARSMATRGGPGNNMRDLFLQLPGGPGSDISRGMENMERIRAGPSQGGKRPEDMSPQELHNVLWQVLTFRDSVVKKIEITIEKVPGLSSIVGKISESFQAFIFTTIEPYVKPVLSAATSGLSSASSEVINNHDQYEVFNDPRASDPTHSFLSKDHFNLILNEPAGNLAKIIVKHTVIGVVKAWDDTSVNVNQVTETILSCLFHPEFHDSNSVIQREMLQYMRDWVDRLGHNKHEIVRRLGKQAVRNHENVRLGKEGQATHDHGKPSGSGGGLLSNASANVQSSVQGYVNTIPGVSQAQSVIGFFTEGPGGRRDLPGGAPGGPIQVGAGGYGPPAVSSYDTTQTTVETTASSYYSSPPVALPGGPPSGGHAPEGSSYWSGGAPTASPPLGGPVGGYVGGYGHGPGGHHQSSYNQSSYSSSSFPQEGSFPGGHGASHPHSPTTYTPGQGFPGGPNVPAPDYQYGSAGSYQQSSYSTGPGGFPDADSYGPPGGPGFGMPNAPPAGPTFPGAPTEGSHYTPPPGGHQFPGAGGGYGGGYGSGW